MFKIRSRLPAAAFKLSGLVETTKLSAPISLAAAQTLYYEPYMGKGVGRGGVHPWVKKIFWSTPEVKKYGGAASLGWRRGSAAENFLTLPCNSRSKNGEKWTLPRVKWVPPPSKIGADSLKMAKVPRELAPQVKNFPAAEGGRQIFDIAPWELTPQVTFFACPCMFVGN